MVNITDSQMNILVNCIGAVETGGQVYSKRRYDDYTNAYTNTANEDSITIGAFQEFKSNAKALLQDIKDTYPNTFNKYDNADIVSDLKKTSWSGYNPSKTSEKAKAIVNIISSDDGKRVQDIRIIKLLNQYISYAENLGVENIDSLFMCANFIHQGGNSACKRIVGKISKPYTLDKLYNATLSDTGNQVGVYKTRQKLMYIWIKQYISNSSTDTNIDTNTTNNGGVTMISNSGHDENNKYSGGVAGDQTGGEWSIINWYNRPWTCVLRHLDANVRERIAYNAEAAARNNLVGYDQNQRDTYWQHLKASNYDPAQITIACEADCSAGVIANTKAAGYTLNNSQLKNLSASYTGDMRAGFKAAGFQVLTDSKYLTSSEYLLRGDILLYDNHHTATNLTDGSKASSSSSGSSSSGSTTSSSSGDLSKTVQWTGITTADELNVRTWAGTSNGTCSFSPLKNGTEVGVCDSQKASDGNTWYFIKYGTKYGFVHSNYVSKKTTSSSSSTTATSSDDLNRTQKWVGKVTADSLNVRTWAGTENPNIKSYPKLNKGNLVGVCDTAKDSKGNNWYYIIIANKYYGFVSSEYIQKV